MEIRAIFLSKGHDFKGRFGKGRLENSIESVTEASCVAGKGLVGDRYFGFKENFKGQITFFDWAVFEEVRTHFSLSDLEPSVFRRNVITSGLDLNSLIGQSFEVQGVKFEGSEECAPCFWMDEAVAPGTETFLKGRGGLRARILSDGSIRKGKA
ncbi:MAG: MOSC domain-containing protein [Verrucomicrobiota bacterium]